MGTYTTNYNLFMPSIGEQGWGDLVNGNFSTIDTTMKGLDTRTGTLESEMNAVEERVTALEPLSIIQVDENQNVTFPAKITASEFVGGVGNFSSLVMPTLSYNGFYDYTLAGNAGSSNGNDSPTATIFSSPFPISGVVNVSVSLGNSTQAYLDIISTSGIATHTLTTTRTDYNITNAFVIMIRINATGYNASSTVFHIGVPKLV